MEGFKLLDGSGPVMLSAPHAVEQTREGRIKYAEPHTGVLALQVHKALGCPCIYKTANCGDDANYDEHSPYKKALQEYVVSHGIKFLIDLHQLSPTRDVQVCLGTGQLQNLKKFDYVNVALAAFSIQHLGLIQIDKPFAAAGPTTVSSYIARTCGISCLQLEINTAIVESAEVYDALTYIVERGAKV